MGLDSYFEKVKSEYSHPLATKEDPYAGPYRIVETRDEFGYFRKFNALHNFIVNNFAEGVDVCQTIYLGTEQIYHTLNVLTDIRDDHSKAEQLMPTGAGFFFGSLDYDEWYFGGIDEAIRILGKALAEIDFDNGEYLVYRASW